MPAEISEVDIALSSNSVVLNMQQLMQSEK